MHGHMGLLRVAAPESGFPFPPCRVCRSAMQKQANLSGCQVGDLARVRQMRWIHCNGIGEKQGLDKMLRQEGGIVTGDFACSDLGFEVPGQWCADQIG